MKPESNDCVVRAFAAAAQADYQDAHAACELLGRRRNHGCSTACIIDRAMDLLGCVAEPVFDYSDGWKKVTFKTLSKRLTTGRYVATIAHHAFAIEVEDCGGRPLAFANVKQLARLKYVWRITPRVS